MGHTSIHVLKEIDDRYPIFRQTYIWNIINDILLTCGLLT